MHSSNLFKSIALSLTLLLGFAFAAQAQQDAQATAVLNKARAKVNNMTDLSVTFKKSIKMNSGRALGTGYTGKLMMKGERFRVNIQNQTVISDGTTQWAINKLDEEVIISKVDEEQAFTPDRLFRLSQKDMRTKYHGMDGGMHKVEMIPNKEEDYFKSYIWIGQDNLPKKMEVYNRNGSIITYAVEDVKYNTGLSASLFAFNKSKYGDYYIEDMR
ncbi:MAG: LolA family protein [Bacteroidota bacterium]